MQHRTARALVGKLGLPGLAEPPPDSGFQAAPEIGIILRFGFHPGNPVEAIIVFLGFPPRSENYSRIAGISSRWVMKRFGAASFLVLICLTSSLAADLPARKAGLWQTNTTTANGHAVSLQECVDAQTDQAMQSRFASMPRRNCSKHNVQKSGDTITIDSICTIAGQAVSSHIVVAGSFDSNYTMTMTSQAQGLPAPRTTTTTAKWLGPCAAGQRPGDIIMPNGRTMNILDFQRAMPGAPGAPGAPMAPHQ